MAIKRIRAFLFALVAFSSGVFFGIYWRLSYQSALVITRKNGVMRDTPRISSTLHHQKSPDAAPLHPQCAPHSNIMFLKTHKTASTAVQNILLRYADKNKLTVGLSTTHDIRFHYGKKFQADFVAKSQTPINILCHHMVFNEPEVRKVMPSDSVYVTILREPTSLFESMFDYFHYDSTPFRRVKRNQLEFWLDHANIYFRGRRDGAFPWFAKNGVFFDMGYDNLSEDDMYIQNAIEELARVFDLVLLSDYFSESMLLLKEKMCWSMEDILALKTNARSNAHTNLTDAIKTKIRSWNKADAAIYDYFNHTFWEKVEEYGIDRMQRDLKLLGEMNQNLQERCLEGGAVTNDKIKERTNKVYNPPGVKMKGYNIKDSAKSDKNCVNLIKGEIQWTREMMAAARSNKTRT